VRGLSTLAETLHPVLILPSTLGILKNLSAFHLESGGSPSADRGHSDWSAQCTRCALPQSFLYQFLGTHEREDGAVTGLMHEERVGHSHLDLTGATVPNVGLANFAVADYI